ncbi:MAG: 30S ribosomal protein S20 [Bacilli bacterium]|nr:30S ribosomal protein S20 [Bacilli bacterium]
MPNIKSAKKRVLITAKKKENNTKARGAMKTAIKKLVKDTKPSAESFNETVKKIDKALKKGIIKKNTAARKKSRLAKAINKLK